MGILSIFNDFIISTEIEPPFSCKVIYPQRNWGLLQK
jgi:hypothetical protein